LVGDSTFRRRYDDVYDYDRFSNWYDVPLRITPTPYPSVYHSDFLIKEVFHGKRVVLSMRLHKRLYGSLNSFQSVWFPKFLGYMDVARKIKAQTISKESYNVR